MKKSDCFTKTDTVVISPIIREKPEKIWVSSMESNNIPKPLFDFYLLAEHFSFGKCPKFLDDDKKILFSHLEAAVNLVRDSFDWYGELVALIKQQDALRYSPFNKTSFDPNAPKYAEMYFQILIIKMFSILDAMSSVIAIVIPFGDIGRASFPKLVTEAQKYSQKNNVKIINPQTDFLEKIFNIIKEEVNKQGDGKGWYELFKLYRDKMSHYIFNRAFWFHDKERKFFNFLPKRWPYYISQDIKEAPADHRRAEPKKDIFDDLIMDQDFFEYLEGLKKQIFVLADHLFAVIADAYRLKKETGCVIDANTQKQILKLVKEYEFKSF